MSPPRPARLPTRAWNVQIQPRRTAGKLVCSSCGPLPTPVATRQAEPLPRRAQRHLAEHAARTPLSLYLRVCQCRENGCHWHRQHLHCDGPLVLLLTRIENGRAWRLADTCLRCAHATPHAARVPEPEPPDTNTTAPIPSETGIPAAEDGNFFWYYGVRGD